MTNLTASMQVHSVHSTLIAFASIAIRSRFVPGSFCCAGQGPTPLVVAFQDRCSQCFVAVSDTGTHAAGANAAEQHACCLHLHTASVPGMQVVTAPLATMHVISKAHQFQQGCCLAGDEDPSECTLDTACILSTRLSTTSRLFVMLSCFLAHIVNTLAVPVWYQAATCRLCASPPRL